MVLAGRRRRPGVADDARPGAPGSAAGPGRPLRSSRRAARPPRRGRRRAGGAQAPSHRARGVPLAQGAGRGDARHRRRRVLRVGDSGGRLPRSRPRARRPGAARLAAGRERRALDVRRGVCRRCRPARGWPPGWPRRSRSSSGCRSRTRCSSCRPTPAGSSISSGRDRGAAPRPRRGRRARPRPAPARASAPSPCVVACHGLSASKDSDKYLLLGDELPAAGLALARFDFRGCGESSGVEEETTIATRIEDVETVLAFLRRPSPAGRPLRPARLEPRGLRRAARGRAAGRVCPW